MSIYLAQKTKIALLLTEKVNFPVKCLDFANVFWKKLAVEIPKHSNINTYLINVELGK